MAELKNAFRDEIDYTLDGHTHSVKPEFNEYPSYI
jgi:hypothetical protein